MLLLIIKLPTPDGDQNSKDDKDEKRPESTAIRRRRINRERRSTGIASYTPEV